MPPRPLLAVVVAVTTVVAVLEVVGAGVLAIEPRLNPGTKRFSFSSTTTSNLTTSFIFFVNNLEF